MSDAIRNEVEVTHDEVAAEIGLLPSYIDEMKERTKTLKTPVTGLYWPAHGTNDRGLYCGAVTVFPDGFARCYGIRLEPYPIGEGVDRRMIGEVWSWDPSRTYVSSMARLVVRAAEAGARHPISAYVLPTFPGGDPIFPPIVPYTTKAAYGAVPRALASALPRSYILHRKVRNP